MKFTTRCEVLVVACVLLLPVVTAQPGPCRRAARRCNLMFEGTDGLVFRFSPGEPNTPLTPRIVSKGDERIGRIFRMGVISAVLVGGRETPVTEFSVTNTFIRPVPIPNSPGSALGHLPFTAEMLNMERTGGCLRIFFRNFQILSEDESTVLETRTGVPRNENMCVVVKAPDP